LLSAFSRVERRQELVGVEVGIAILVDGTEVAVVVRVVVAGAGLRPPATESERCTPCDTETTENCPTVDVRISAERVHEAFFELFCDCCRTIVRYRRHSRPLSLVGLQLILICCLILR
jgi:hypothetical protein